MRWFVILLLFIPSFSFGQGAATLVADQVRIEDGGRLIATGNIEVFYDGTRLSAAEIIYDDASDRLQIIGPIFIENPDGSVLTAERASLDPKLESGILRGARLVLNRQLQLAAHQIDRSAGRYNQLYKVAATSCQVCGTQAPLWDIRAERVVHDEEEQQLYFTNALFRVRGVPIFWLPRARLPDPTLERATGFLIPSLRNSDRLGVGITIPYFITLGDHRDFTLTPYLSRQTRTLETRYRQAFFSGSVEVNSAFSQDTLFDENRSYLFANGSFHLRNDYQLAFDIEAASDTAYLLDYDYSDADRLDSAINVTRVKDDELFFASVTYFESLRDGEVDAELPPIVADFLYEKRFRSLADSAITLSASGDFLYRYGEGLGDAGRDMLRLGFASDWQRSWNTDTGLFLNGNAGISADLYRVWDDPTTETVFARSVPHAELTLRYPLKKSTTQAVHILEPALALTWSKQLGDTPPNEDSTRPEFDPGNLFALSRMPGNDAVENGLRFATGLNWTRRSRETSTTRLTFGRVFREDEQDQFSASSGLDGLHSDWLIAGQYDTGKGIRIEGRALFDDQFDITTGAANVGWQSSDVALTASYIWEAPDPDLGRNAAAAAWAVDSRFQLHDAWAVELDARYDVVADTPTRAGLGIEWRNECVTVDLSVRRRFTSSTTVAPSTDYGLSVALTGFSAGRSAAGPQSGCYGK